MSDKYADNYDAVAWGKKLHNATEVSYYSANYFFNDLDDENDYYLEVRLSGENKFVRKVEIDERNNPRRMA